MQLASAQWINVSDKCLALYATHTQHILGCRQSWVGEKLCQKRNICFQTAKSVPGLTLGLFCLFNTRPDLLTLMRQQEECLIRLKSLKKDMMSPTWVHWYVCVFGVESYKDTNEKGSLTALNPSSCWRYTIVAKSCVMLSEPERKMN